MKIFDSRKSIVLASIGVLFASLALVSCEKREEPLLNEMAKYSKTIVFTEQQQQTRASYIDYTTAMPSAEYVLRTEESTDSLFLSEYVSDLESEQLMTRAEETTTANLGEFRILAYNVGAGGDLSINQNLSKLVGKKNDGTWSYGAVTNQDDINWSELGSNDVKFFAYANLTTGMATLVENSSTQFQLTLPTNAADQADIIVAEAEGSYNSSTTEQVPLTFDHICAGVRFIVGDREQGIKSGRILKVELEGITIKGIYDIVNNRWTPSSEKGKSYLNVSNETTMQENIFMLIPQGPFGTTTKINVYYGTSLDNENNYSILEASLQNVKWEQGNLYTYVINQSKINLFSFGSSTEKYVDAHYVMDSIEIYVNPSAGGWTLVSDNSNVTLAKALTDIQKLGYWTLGESSDARTTSISGTNSGRFKIYYFCNENIVKPDANNDGTRNVILTLRRTNQTNDPEKKTFTIRQLCPTWTGNIGCERIEEIPNEPWGPYWVLDEGATEPEVTYDLSIKGNNIEELWNSFVNKLMLRWYLSQLEDNNDLSSVIEINKYDIKILGFIKLGEGYSSVDIKYSDYMNFDSWALYDDGKENTWGIYNGADLSLLLEFEDVLAQYGYTPTSSNFTKVPTEHSAIWSSVKKNKFIEERKTIDGKEVWVQQIDETACHWYCPSLKECSDDKVLKNNLMFVDGETEIEVGSEYWTSTVEQGSNDNSRTFYIANPSTGDGSPGTAQRNDAKKIRAVTKFNR